MGAVQYCPSTKAKHSNTGVSIYGQFWTYDILPSQCCLMFQYIYDLNVSIEQCYYDVLKF